MTSIWYRLKTFSSFTSGQGLGSGRVHASFGLELGGCQPLRYEFLKDPTWSNFPVKRSHGENNEVI